MGQAGSDPGLGGGCCRAFGLRCSPGDLVIYPYKPDSTLNFGRITSDYHYEASASWHRNRRKAG